MRREKLAIADIYVPVKRRAILRPETVQQKPFWPLNHFTLPCNSYFRYERRQSDAAGRVVRPKLD
jgi:hypothetical protein